MQRPASTYEYGAYFPIRLPCETNVEPFQPDDNDREDMDKNAIAEGFQPGKYVSGRVVKAVLIPYYLGLALVSFINRVQFWVKKHLISFGRGYPFAR